LSAPDRLSTALLVARQTPEGISVDDQTRRLSELKPHVSLEDAGYAVQAVDSIIAKARENALI
jgi:hypothetical protein